MQPLIIAVETSGRKGSVALARGAQVLCQREFSAPMRHSAELLPAIENLLNQFDGKPDQIEHIYISVGPGSFTGLRIAVSFAKTMHLGQPVKIVAVNTLDVIAANAAALPDDKQPQILATILDAKRGQFYVAVYENKHSSLNEPTYKKVLTNGLMSADEFIEKFGNSDTPVSLIGEGLVYYADKFKAPSIEILDEKLWWPSAANVHNLGWQKAQTNDFTNALTLTPSYLRQPQLGISPLRISI